MVLYNPGGGRGSDFLAVEILEGAVRVKTAKGQIVHTARVNDGRWHKMHLLFNPSLIEVSQPVRGSPIIRRWLAKM